ncbi:unnamed protein product [Brassica oleracea var. botrytis]
MSYTKVMIKVISQNLVLFTDKESKCPSHNLHTPPMRSFMYFDLLMRTLASDVNAMAKELREKRKENGGIKHGYVNQRQRETIMATGQVIVEEMNPKSDDQYKAWKTLDHPTKLKAVASNHLLSSFYRFAVAGGNMVTICELPNDAANNLVLNEKPYIDDTVVESFLAVSWAEKDDTHYILAGGLMCIIRSSICFFSCLIFDLQTLSGHDDSITDIQCSPFDNALVLSASQDRTVRFNFYAVLLLLVTDFFQSFFSLFIFRIRLLFWVPRS